MVPFDLELDSRTRIPIGSIIFYIQQGSGCDSQREATPPAGRECTETRILEGFSSPIRFSTWTWLRCAGARGDVEPVAFEHAFLVFRVGRETFPSGSFQIWMDYCPKLLRSTCCLNYPINYSTNYCKLLCVLNANFLIVKTIWACLSHSSTTRIVISRIGSKPISWTRRSIPVGRRTRVNCCRPMSIWPATSVPRCCPSSPTRPSRMGPVARFKAWSMWPWLTPTNSCSTLVFSIWLVPITTRGPSTRTRN